MAKKKPATNGQKLPDKVKFDYIKSNFHRVVHSDGVWGGTTPRQKFIMSFWSERPPIPQQVVHPVEEGKLGAEDKSEREGRDAIIREVEVSVLMDLSTAKTFLVWLQERVSAAEKIAKEGTDDDA